MIIRTMRATFGKLEERELKLKPGLNVINGCNETGKSTWLAFLLTMFYGVKPKDKLRPNKLPDQLKYQPWSGKSMSGTLELSDGERHLTLERSSETGPMADFRAWDTDTGETVEALSGESCGQSLLGVEAAVYARSGCLRQQHISVSADARLEKRLCGLVTSGNEDYAYTETEEKLAEMQKALVDGDTGALPAAREDLNHIQARLEEIAAGRSRLSELERQLRSLKTEREECRTLLTELEELEQSERRERLDAAQAALDAAVAERTGLEAVCAEFPKEEELQALQTELQELQADLEKAAAEGGISLSELELPEADPIFGRMGPEEAHDKAAADATLIQKARSAERPRRSRSLLWLAMVLVGLGVGFGGALLPLLPLVVVGSALALGGLALWIVQRVRFNRLRETYLELQRQARAILEQYEVKNAKGIVLRGIEYIRSLEDRERDEDGGVSRQILAKLADRKDAIFARLEELSPGCGEPDTAAELFRKAAQAYQALAKAKLAEEQRMHQLLDLRMALGEDIANAEAQRLEDFDRETEAQRLESLDAQIQALSSQADQLSGALGQMGDPLALEAEGEALRRRISRMEERLAALDMARTALKEADEAMRARFAPLLCEKAGALFRRLTGGKYDEIQLDRELHVTVRPTGSDSFRALAYLSGGTVDQLYLALRLAICELLLPEAPIVLDDALVYFDDNRAALALDTLRQMSKTRQILIFTSQSREKRILDQLAAKRRAAEKAAASKANIKDKTDGEPKSEPASEPAQKPSSEPEA